MRRFIDNLGAPSNGVFPRRRRESKLIYETPVSTVKNPAQTAARVSRPQIHQERPRHAAQPTPRGAQTSDARLIRPPMPASSPDAPARRDPTPDAGHLRLRRPARLQHQRDFARVRQQGQRLALGCLVANWHPLPEGATPRLGVVTSRKIGGAVVRSRARRLLRESFRQHQKEFAQPVELVLVARNSIAGKKFAEVEKDFLTTLRRAGLLK